MPEPIKANQIFDRTNLLDFSSRQVDPIDFFNNALVKKVNNAERILGIVEKSEEKSQKIEDEFDNSVIQQLKDEKIEEAYDPIFSNKEQEPDFFDTQLGVGVDFDDGFDDTPISGNFGKFNKESQARLSKLTEADKERMIRMVWAETGSMGAQARLGVAETMRNRYLSPNHPNSMRSILKWTDEGKGGYYQSDAGNKSRFAKLKKGSKQWKLAEQAVNQALSGSNTTGGAMHNWGAKDGSASGAIREMSRYGIKTAGGRTLGGEYYYVKRGEKLNIFK